MHDNRIVELEVEASWFVYGMMRFIAATLVEVGSGALSIEEFFDIFREGRRHDIKHSAPACGLCLMEVKYSRDMHLFSTMPMSTIPS